jgi:glutathione S-transferase
MRTLYSLPYSPWTERVRWVLLHHGFEFVEQPHTPLIGELSLRVRARRFRGRVSVPLLVDGSNPVMDSLAIAEYVDAMGGQSSLFPGDLRGPIRVWNAQLEPTCWCGRAWLTSSMDDAAALELMPAALRSLPFAVQSARLGAAFIARKHPTPTGDLQQRFAEGYREIRQALAGKPYVHYDFTYADIVCATALQFVSPLPDAYLPIGAASRSCWRHAALCDEFSDLIGWRDDLYRRHRPLPSQPTTASIK